MRDTVRINSAGTVQCEPGWQWDIAADRRIDFDAWYVWSGVGMLTVAGTAHRASRGAFFVLKPGESVSGRHDPERPLGVTYIHFDGNANAAALRTDVADADLYERMMRRIAQLFATQQATATMAAERQLESLLIALPYEAAQPPRAEDAVAERVREVARHVREHPAVLYTIDDLAARADFAPDHFSVVFKRVMGVGPKEFCIRVRLDRACELLRDSTLAVGEIARMLGYADVYFFSRQFKARTGQSPVRWRHTYLSKSQESGPLSRVLTGEG